ncbi:MAG: hypothetical protein Q9157_004895 [Trypethelium eluteriae]
MSQFAKNIDDAVKAIRRMPETITTAGNEPALRLWTILKHTINQHILLFKTFARWADGKAASNIGGNERPFSERIAQYSQQIETKLRPRDHTGLDLFGEIQLSDEDLDVFLKIEEKWICRIPSEITLLILRISVAECPGSDINHVKSSLAKFLDELSSVEWKSPTSRPKSDCQFPPLVPDTFCFDATKKRIGISRPSRFGCSPLDKFFLRARDVRVAEVSAQTHFREAQAMLDRILGEEDGGVRLDWETAIRPKFLKEYGKGPLQRYEENIWQTIDQNF